MSTLLFVVLITAAPPSAAVPATSDTAVRTASTSAGGAPQQAARPAGRSAKELRDDVHKTLRTAAVQSGAEREAAIRRLTSLYGELKHDTQVPMDERLVLARTVRGRLIKVKDQLTRAARGSATVSKSSPAASSQSTASQSMSANSSASASSSAQGRLGGATADDAGQELVDLIERTIAPDTWDTVGGEGSIRYYSTWHALVVRQTDEVHDLVRGVVDGLRN